ncbi:MAG: hypothetical protein SFY56_01785, partial [Bacteroidota bacterium]|nr:hypothetical protein [Bacteroidota bacterium]
MFVYIILHLFVFLVRLISMVLALTPNVMAARRSAFYHQCQSLPKVTIIFQKKALRLSRLLGAVVCFGVVQA